MKASVIICTYNRHELLSTSLESLLIQSFPKDSYEIVVVDNNSTDHTRKVVEKLTGASPVPVKYIFEECQGLSYARNTGIKHSLGEIIVFTDDDIEADENWLCEMVDAFHADDVVCAGGPIEPIWPFDKPEWLSERWQVYLGVYGFEYALETGILHGPSYPCGVNIAFRRDIFDVVGMFSTDLGRIGPCLLSNEESRVCQQIEDLGKKICFARNALIHHKISPERLTKQWFYHRMYWQGRSDAILDDSLRNKANVKVADYISRLATSQSARCVDFDSKCEARLMQGYVLQYLALITTGNTTKALKSFLKMVNLINLAAPDISKIQVSEYTCTYTEKKEQTGCMPDETSSYHKINLAFKKLLKKISP